MKNWYLILLSLVAAFILFIALSILYEQKTPEELDLSEPIQIVMKSIEGQPMDFWDVVTQGIDEAAREFGVEVKITGPRYEKEINRQINIMDAVIDERPPIIILAANDYKRLVGSVEKADALGIPVVTMDSGIQSDIPVSFIATDNIDAGNKAGDEMKRLILLNSRKSIAIVSHIKETATAIDREAGVREALLDENVIGTWFCDVEQEKAYLITLELLKDESLGGVVALNEVAALGVARAIDEMDAEGKVFVVGFDSAVRELSYLEEGIIKATVVQRPYNMGYITIKTAVDYLKGNKIETFIDTGSILITRENMFQREYQELLFPVSN
ncbi:MAG: substrate-binding domain-containing protein [Spirochaetia bacterium]|jgi:ribose transport system substrate-binding protein|nr:substrate-binding domain-containing protein [Spirochaetia bacterium]